MKRYCLPDTFIEEVLPTIPAEVQAVFFALIWHSNQSMKAVWPGLAKLKKMSGTGSISSTRRRLRWLEDHGILTRRVVPEIQLHERGKPGNFVNAYYFHMDIWIQKDIAAKKSKARDFVSDDATREIVYDAVHETLNAFDFAKLPANLRQWGEYLEHVGKFEKTHYFKSKTNVSPSFVEGEFKKAGILIKLVKQAS